MRYGSIDWFFLKDATHLDVDNVQLLLLVSGFFFNQPVFQPSSGDMSKLRTIDKIPKRTPPPRSPFLTKRKLIRFFFSFKKKKKKIGIVFRRGRRKKNVKKQEKKLDWGGGVIWNKKLYCKFERGVFVYRSSQ